MTRQPVDSSNLKSVGYDPKTETLEVEFANGGVHSYAGVPATKHSALMKSPSPGSFFHVHIRGKAFKSTKVA